MESESVVVVPRVPWNKGKLTGQMPLKLREIWAIRTRLQMASNVRELAIDSRLRTCDLTRLRVQDVRHRSQVASRATVMQQKTQRPVQFEITEQTRESVERSLAGQEQTLTRATRGFVGRDSCQQWPRVTSSSRMKSGHHVDAIA